MGMGRDGGGRNPRKGPFIGSLYERPNLSHQIWRLNTRGSKEAKKMKRKITGTKEQNISSSLSDPDQNLKHKSQT